MSFNFTVTPRNEILLITTARSLLKSNSGDKEKYACVDLAEKFCVGLMKIMKIDKNRGVCRACSSLSLSTFTFRDGGGGLFQHTHRDNARRLASLIYIHACVHARRRLPPTRPWCRCTPGAVTPGGGGGGRRHSRSLQCKFSQPHLTF